MLKVICRVESELISVNFLFPLSYIKSDCSLSCHFE